VTNDNIAIIVPNSKFIDSPVTNWSMAIPVCGFVFRLAWPMAAT